MHVASQPGWPLTVPKLPDRITSGRYVTPRSGQAASVVGISALAAVWVLAHVAAPSVRMSERSAIVPRERGMWSCALPSSAVSPPPIAASSAAAAIRPAK